MRFVVNARAKHMVPPAVSINLIDAMEFWQKEYSSKIEQAWGFAGIQGGGGILNVESLEELDAVMGSFPFIEVYEVEILPIIELGESLERSKKVLQARALKARFS
jgi:hypothetical protein